MDFINAWKQRIFSELTESRLYSSAVFKFNVIYMLQAIGGPSCIFCNSIVLHNCTTFKVANIPVVSWAGVYTGWKMRALGNYCPPLLREFPPLRTTHGVKGKLNIIWLFQSCCGATISLNSGLGKASQLDLILSYIWMFHVSMSTLLVLLL